jgi:hypothetical protein
MWSHNWLYLPPFPLCPLSCLPRTTMMIMGTRRKRSAVVRVS